MKNALKTFAMTFFVTICLFGLAWSIFMMTTTVRSSKQAEQSYTEMQDSYKEQPASAEETADTEDAFALPTIKWQELMSANRDVVGWVYCPGTAIDYPVVQSHDNAEYLVKMADGTPNPHGAIFVDADNSGLFVQDNTIIYGHNMNDGTMFRDLNLWKDRDFAAEHPVVYLLTPSRTYEIQVFSGFVAEADSPVYDVFCGSNKNEWIDTWARKSFFTAGFTPSAADKIVTFSTCTGDDQRFVLIGVQRVYQ